MGSGLRRLWFDVIRTAFLLVFRLSAAHLRTVTLDAYALEDWWKLNIVFLRTEEEVQGSLTSCVDGNCLFFVACV